MKKRIEEINYIRIGCMLAILLFHARIHYGLSLGNLVLDEFVSIGAVAIVGFFMISGFCIRQQYRGMKTIIGGVFKKEAGWNLSKFSFFTALFVHF